MVAARTELLSQLATFNSDELTQQPIEGEWPPLQIANHIYITDGLVLTQMKRVQEEENPLLENTGQVAPRMTEASELPASLDVVLAGIAARREALFVYLAELAPEAWERPFRHEEWGERKFYQLVNVLPVHDQQHAQQLARMRETMTHPGE
jgi:hypothetical protein